MQLANPGYLWLLLLIVPLVVWYIWKQKNLYATLHVSSTSGFAGLGTPWKVYLRHVVFALQMATLACLVIILARPQTYDSWRNSEVKGTDIVLAIDISSSMLARDFKPDRFEAAKTVASQFAAGREGDNIGVVIFAGESFTLLPMTTDRSLVANYINDIQMGMLVDETAVGDGLATAINRVKDGHAKSKSIILLTDGMNNRGNVMPLTAAEIAKQMGIKVYTIGVGKRGKAPYPAQNMFGQIEYVQMDVNIDEATLQQIAEMTGGKYYRATDENVLQQVFDDIDKLEKTTIKVDSFTQTEDDYLMWGLLALGLFALGQLIRYTILRSIP